MNNKLELGQQVVIIEEGIYNGSGGKIISLSSERVVVAINHHHDGSFDRIFNREDIRIDNEAI